MDEIEQGGIGFLFLYIGIGIALLLTVVSGVNVVFGIIDRLVLHDSVSWYSLYHSTELPVSAAFLLVSFIVLFIILRKTRSFGSSYHGTIWQTLCRAIILIILTVSVGMLAVSFSFLFGKFLSGDISFNSFLKMFFVAGVGAVVFYYYRGVLQGVWRDRRKEERIFVSTISVAVVLIFITASVLSDPFHRSQMEDTYEQLAGIDRVYYSLEYFYREEERLPTSLDAGDFSKAKHYPLDDHDGVSYEVVGESSFRLCASFEVLPKGTGMKRYPYTRFEVEHIGENCFDFTL